MSPGPVSGQYQDPRSIDAEPIRSGCGERIDPETCWCGDDKSGVHDGHNFVPIGCRCMMEDQ